MKTYIIKREEVLFFEVKADSIRGAQRIADNAGDSDFKMEVESIVNRVVTESGKEIKRPNIILIKEI